MTYSIASGSLTGHFLLRLKIRRSCAQFGADGGGDGGGVAVHVGFGFGFDHDAGEGFGAGVADDDAAGLGEGEVALGGGDVEELSTRAARLVLWVAGDGLAGLSDPRQLLDVDVQQVPRSVALVTNDGDPRLQHPTLFNFSRTRMRLTVARLY